MFNWPYVSLQMFLTSSAIGIWYCPAFVIFHSESWTLFCECIFIQIVMDERDWHETVSVSHWLTTCNYLKKCQLLLLTVCFIFLNWRWDFKDKPCVFMGKEIELKETGIYQLFMPGMHPLQWILFGECLVNVSLHSKFKKTFCSYSSHHDSLLVMT